MKTQRGLLLVFLFLGGLLGMLACSDEEQVGRFEEDVLSFEQKIDSFIKGCVPDSAGCVRVKLNYPLPESGPDPAIQGIKRAQNWFVNSYLSGRIDPNAIYTSMEPAIDDYLEKQYEKQLRKGGNSSDYYNRISGEILFENSRILTLEMRMNSFTGGLHPVELRNIFTVDVSSGTMHRNVNHWISNRDSLTTIAEQYFRRHRNISADKELSKTGFYFRKGFKLPKSMGFTPRGLLLHYNAYEEGPYSMGPTRFTIPYEGIEGVIKMNEIHPQ